MTVSERPEPAVRRRSRLTQEVVNALRTADITTTNSREIECQECWNRTVQLRVKVDIRRDWYSRTILGIAVLCAVACAWLAWSTRTDKVAAEAIRDAILKESR